LFLAATFTSTFHNKENTHFSRSKKMISLKYCTALLFLSLTGCFQCAAADGEHHAVYARIHPTSIKELLLFYSLYPDTPEGKEALQQAWTLLSGEKTSSSPSIPPNFADNIETLLSLVNPTISLQNKAPVLSEAALTLVEQIGSSLPHRKLKGHTAKNLKEVLLLPPEEIDVSRAVLLLNDSPPKDLATVEASLDILALQVLARIGQKATWEEKITELNHFLFFELGIRFPPQSETEEKTKNFSDVSSVLFSRRGVCLGASVLYLCLAQRLDLHLSIYTPPGHIFVGYKDNASVRTIETTARGISIPIKEYYGLTVKYLPERTMKEVVGMVLFNNAAGLLQQKKFTEALSCYEKALQFEESEELFELTSLCHLLLGNKKQSAAIAKQELSRPRPHLLERDILLHDLCLGNLSPVGASVILSHTKDDEASLQQEISELKSLIPSCPNSWALPFHLAHAYLQLGKTKEAVPLLEKLCSQTEAPPSLHALLASIYLERMNPEACWKEATTAVKLAKTRGAIPEPLRQFVIDLHIQYPRPSEVLEAL
jgi:regulator of sirC expression with transglutaminase-like and TPR domain